MDKFILVAAGPKLCLYKYLLEDQKDDLKRFERGRGKNKEGKGMKRSKLIFIVD